MASNLNRQHVTRLLFIFALAAACAVGVWKMGITKGLDLEGGTELLYAVRATGLEGMQPDLVEKTIAVVQRRIDPQGVLDADIRPRGVNRFMIRLPKMNLDEAERIEERVKKSGRLLFSLVNTRKDDIERASEGKPVPGHTPFVKQHLLSDTADVEGSERYRRATYRKVEELGLTPANFLGPGVAGEPLAMLVSDTPEITGDRLDAGGVSAVTHEGKRTVGFAFRPEARRKFLAITRRHKNKHLAIILDNILYSAPRIQSEIAGRGVITSPDGFEPQELEDLILTLRSGSLPADIELQSKNSIGPELGQDSIEAGFRAAVIGFVLVVILMAVYYLALGVIADIALLLNLVFILGALAALRATLTLPGIAGLILTVGMAVDANVLILERIREERARGKTLRLAVKNGYEMASRAIIDANITTLMTAIILFFIGTGPIQGFATVLSIGIISSLFSALFVSRVLTEALLSTNILHRLAMLQIIKRPHITFTRVRYVAGVCSLVLIIAGMTVWYQRGDKKFDSDLIGGFMADMAFSRELAIGEVRERVAEAGYPDAEIQSLWIAGAGDKQGPPRYSIRVKRPALPKALGKIEADIKQQFLQAGVLDSVTAGDPETNPWFYRIALNEPATEAFVRETLIDAGYQTSDIRRLVGFEPAGAPVTDRRFVLHLTSGSNEEPAEVAAAVRAAVRGLTAVNNATFTAGTIQEEAEGQGFSVELNFEDFVLITALQDTILRDVAADPEEAPELRVAGIGSDRGSQRCLKVEVSASNQDILRRLIALPDGQIAIPNIVQTNTGDMEIATREKVSEDTIRAALPEDLRTNNVTGIVPQNAVATAYEAELGMRDEGEIKLREGKVVEMIKDDLEAEFKDDLYHKALHIELGAVTSPPAAYADDVEDLIDKGWAFVKLTILDPENDNAPYPIPVQTVIDNLRQASAPDNDLTDNLLLSEEQRSELQMERISEVYLKYRPGDDPGAARTALAERLKPAFTEERAFRRTESVGERVSGEMRDQAFWAIVVALMAIVFYIWFRFGEFKFGVGAIVALAHDVLMTMGAIAVADALSDTALGAALGFSDVKINLAMIGAFLTIVGYSLNDTIVAYDRIRENMGGRRRQIDPHLIDTSINQVLSRTLLTSITTLLVVLALYILGGPVIHGFAFALAVGVVVGTYSSIFIASPILVDWHLVVGGVNGLVGVATLRFLRKPGPSKKPSKK